MPRSWRSPAAEPLLTPCPFARNIEDAAEEEPGGGAGGGDGGECGPAPIRPQASRPPGDGDAGRKQALAAAAAMEWQPSLSDRHRECSATSDEDHPRRAPCTSPGWLGCCRHRFATPWASYSLVLGGAAVGSELKHKLCQRREDSVMQWGPALHKGRVGKHIDK